MINDWSIRRFNPLVIILLLLTLLGRCLAVDFDRINENNLQIFWNRCTDGNSASFNMPEILNGINQQAISNIKFQTNEVRNDSFLYVGYPDPNETLTVEDTSRYFECNILVLNNGVFIMKGSSVRIYGSLIAIQNGSIIVDSTQLRLSSAYEWQFCLASLDSARIRITNSGFDYGGYPGYTFIKDNSSLEVENSDYTQTTALYTGYACVTYSNVTGGGEYSARDSSTVHFSNVEFAMIHIQVPESSVVNMNFGTDTLEYVEHWEMNPSSPYASGIGYTIVIDSSNCMFNPSSASGSELTLSDSQCDILVRFTLPVCDTISGLVNHTQYNDWFAPFDDRTIHLVNTTVISWHMQMFSTSNISVENSIIGEFICFDSSEAYLSNSIHDGSGGPLTAAGHSQVYVSYSDIRTNTIKVRNNGLLSLFNCTVWRDFIVADSGLAVVLGTYNLNPIRVFDAGAAIVAAVKSPATAFVDENVSIIGDAYIERTPISPYDFDAYRLYYVYYPIDTIINPDSLEWTAITDWITYQVRDDTLAVWNTSGLDVGRYFLKLDWREASGSVVTAYYVINLREDTFVESGSGSGSPKIFQLYQNHPNPFNSSTNIRYLIARDGHAELKIYNIAGQLVKTLVNEEQKAGNYIIKWDGKDENKKRLPSGIYFVKLEVGDKSLQTKKLLLLSQTQ